MPVASVDVRSALLIFFCLLGLAVIVGASMLLDMRADLKEAEAEARFPPEGQFIDVDGRAVHAVIEGTGPDLILIHGASGNARDLTFSLTKTLSQRYRVITFDRPGLGWTERPSDKFGGAYNTRAESPVEQARFLAKAAEKIGADRPIILGHSYGGAVAMAWALEHDVSGLVILAGATMPWEGGLGTLYAVNASALGGANFVPLITAFAPAKQVDAVLTTIFEPQPVPDGYPQHVGIGLTMRRETLRANARQVNSLLPHIQDMSARYAEIDVPVSILHGTSDVIVPAETHAIPLNEILPNSDLVLLDGIGHMPHHSATDAVLTAIDQTATRAGLH